MPKLSKWKANHAGCQAAVDNVKADLTAEIERLNGEHKRVVDAARSILWMARAYAEGGGSNGPEMQDYEAAVEIIGED